MTAHDLDAILHRKLETLFPEPVARQAALAALRGYGAEPHEREATRVHLAILKISDGTLESIARRARDARVDYRDTLVAAEYPESGARIHTDAAVRAACERRDREQYEAWLSA